MKRYLATTMKLILMEGINFQELMQLLRSTNAEVERDGDFIVYIQNPPKEMFKYTDSFEWVKGISYLWSKEKLVTIDNYKKIDWSTMTNKPPKTEEEF